jgi:hypothetical protein
MMRRPADIEVAAIIISDAKAEYIQSRHGVSSFDVLQAFANRPRYFVDTRGRYAMIGPVTSGRFLLVAMVASSEVPDSWLLITAH